MSRSTSEVLICWSPRMFAITSVAPKTMGRRTSTTRPPARCLSTWAYQISVSNTHRDSLRGRPLPRLAGRFKCAVVVDERCDIGRQLVRGKLWRMTSSFSLKCCQKCGCLLFTAVVRQVRDDRQMMQALRWPSKSKHRLCRSDHLAEDAPVFLTMVHSSSI